MPGTRWIGSPVVGFLTILPPSSRPMNTGLGIMLNSVVLPLPDPA
jgi:hypothetical protein